MSAPVEYEENIEAALHTLDSGGVVLHPTGSLYGLAVDAHNLDAIEGLKKLKGLDSEARPFVVLISSEWVEQLVALDRMTPEQRALARRLVEKYWPGGLTLIVPASKEAPAQACAQGLSGRTLAIRADDHPAAVALCKRFGRPIISTSANRHGEASPHRLDDVPSSLRAQSTLLDLAPAPLGEPSTVLDLVSSPPIVLREGRVPKDALK